MVKFTEDSKPEVSGRQGAEKESAGSANSGIKRNASVKWDRTSTGPPVKQIKRPSHLSDLRDRKNNTRIQSSLPSKKSTSDQPLVHDFITVRADDLRDKDWESRVKDNFGKPGEAAISGDNQRETKDILSSKDEKKKHQINWLALELKQNEEMLLQKIASGKQKQKSGAMKYGW